MLLTLLHLKPQTDSSFPSLPLSLHVLREAESVPSPTLGSRTYTAMWPGRDPHAGPRAPSGRSRAMPGPARTHSQPPGGSNNPQVRLPGGARCCKGPIAAAGRVTRARISPCRVLHTIDWDGLQSLCDLTLVDALHCSLMYANYAHQRQAKIGEPCSGDHQLAGDVRWS